MTLSQRAELNMLREKFRGELKPCGTDEELAVEQVARAAWAIGLLEHQEAEIFQAHANPFLDDKASRSLMGVSALRAHYGNSLQASLRFFFTLAALRRQKDKKLAKPSRGKRTR